MNKIKYFFLLMLLCILISGCAQNNDSQVIDIKPVDYKKVYFNVTEDIYYPVHIPVDINYVTDNAKYIYADDNKLNVSIVSGIDYYKFSDSTLIDNAENVQKNIIATKDWETQDVAEAALYLSNDKAIRVHVEDNKEAFVTILDGLKSEESMQSKYYSLRVPEEKEVISLPQYSGEPEISAGLGGQLRKVYALNEGQDSLSVSQELRKFDEAIKLYEQRIATVTNTDIANLRYYSDNVYYAEVGDYVVGIYKVNFNTVLTCYGFGESAKLNTVFFLMNQD